MAPVDEPVALADAVVHGLGELESPLPVPPGAGILSLEVADEREAGEAPRLAFAVADGALEGQAPLVQVTGPVVVAELAVDATQVAQGHALVAPIADVGTPPGTANPSLGTRVTFEIPDVTINIPGSAQDALDAARDAGISVPSIPSRITFPDVNRSIGVSLGASC